MDTFIGGLIAFFVACVVVRLLRKRYEWVDWVAIAALIIAFILTWITSNFWWAIGVFIAGSIVVSLLLGLGHDEEIHVNGKKYTFKCEKCDYNYVIVNNIGNQAAIVKCPRCGNVQTYILQ